MLYPEIVIENVRKTSRSWKKIKFEKKIICTHMRFWTFDKCNLYQNRKENLAFATRVSEGFENISKMNFSLFQRLSAIEV